MRNTRPGGGIGRRKGLKTLESNLVPVRLRPRIILEKLYFVLLCLFLSSCARGIVPIPETFMPERYSGIVWRMNMANIQKTTKKSSKIIL